MIRRLIRRHRVQLIGAYGLTIAGYAAAQLYPLAIGLAINGVLANDLGAAWWLIGCHVAMVLLEVAAKMTDTRVFTRIHRTLGTETIAIAREAGWAPALVAGRTLLLREYVTFLERDVPAALLSVISFVVALAVLFGFDPAIGLCCIALLLPAAAINARLARRSALLNRGVNDRLEREVAIFQSAGPGRVGRHFRALALWRVRLSDLEATSYGMLELFVILIFGVALWRIAGSGAAEAGTIYATFTYIWRFVTSLDQVPQIVQQIGKLKDIGRRLSEVGART